MAFSGTISRDSGEFFLKNRTIYNEVVFTTGMTGYIESLTDPSYHGQILVFTYPLIGNYGITDYSTWESERIHASGVIISESGGSEFNSWLRDQSIPLLTGVDTRALTKYLRSRGTMLGRIQNTQDQYLDESQIKRLQFISIKEPIIYNKSHEKTIILVDCGTKTNIVRELMQIPYRIKRVPHDYDYTKEDYIGIVISNGPGDPTDYTDTIRIASLAMRKNRPMFGICLGNQIMALAAGAKTYKLKFGHRGQNQPVRHEAWNMGYGTKQTCFITSQNHGYAVDERSLPKDWQVSFRNLNDASVEGIAHRTKPFFAVQFHPEACPGPTDTRWLFSKFEALMSKS